ncbi:DUF1016 N-terminal domain-containing protein [Sphingobacterium faecium]|uniref:DUF1016 N-terminal domain-containing protein n=1 Tax=Sphingobacterium faecium TaxID=34087 RepID=UPI003D363475
MLSEVNLWNMRQFYKVFPEFDQFSTQRVANLSWTNIRLIMRIDELSEREYYIKKVTVDINSLFSPIVHLKKSSNLIIDSY